MSVILSKNFSLLHIGIASGVVALITLSLSHFWKTSEPSGQDEPASYTCNVKVKRMEGYNFVKPLLFVDDECESERFSGLKQQVNAIIEKYKTLGDANVASVYLRSSNDWIVIGEDQKYKPGSLFKLPILMTILKMNEDRPGFIDQKLLFDKPYPGKELRYPSKSIQLGKSYPVSELLKYMIKYSDNNATLLLEQHMDVKILQKLFTDIGLEAPNMYADNFYFTVRDYSLFMRAIYNAGYLTIKDSEYAAELLHECEFSDGIVKGLPTNLEVAHKFGEVGDDEGKQLHETAIVYLGKKPYLITVMTKGANFDKLSSLMSEISNAVYLSMLNQSNV